MRACLRDSCTALALRPRVTTSLFRHIRGDGQIDMCSFYCCVLQRFTESIWTIWIGIPHSPNIVQLTLASPGAAQGCPTV
eukprot:s819_g28.t1